MPLVLDGSTQLQEQQQQQQHREQLQQQGGATAVAAAEAGGQLSPGAVVGSPGPRHGAGPGGRGGTATRPQLLPGWEVGEEAGDGQAVLLGGVRRATRGTQQRAGCWGLVRTALVGQVAWRGWCLEGAERLSSRLPSTCVQLPVVISGIWCLSQQPCSLLMAPERPR